ncbi:hypothetical protein [Undibacterium sp. TS12]|uniref:hypothetical protein n=1 Tax=Undibacterium sp. TS12 TaxID=2908202 RepID=UPI001F4CF3C6|nr:hypothetical protein [Undibacterium sp. TS12]MCH8622356.1 hypothetical protein [Undibacterium sp. TS12]
MFEFIFEVLLQLVAEVLVEVFSWNHTSRKENGPVLLVMGYAFLGLLAGAVSVWIFPHAFIASSTGRVANLVLTPLLMGAFVAVFSAWRTGEDLRFKRFACGYAMALSLALVRFFAASHA